MRGAVLINKQQRLSTHTKQQSSVLQRVGDGGAGDYEEGRAGIGTRAEAAQAPED
jgi:hypothetical protein